MTFSFTLFIRSRILAPVEGEMGARESLQRLIDRKQEEVNELRKALRDAETYINALSEAQRSLPRESAPSPSSQSKSDLRPNTMLHQIREILRENGSPMHISKILEHLNRPTDKKNRVSVSGSLAAYVRSNRIFTRPQPNTFGLVGMRDSSQAAESEVDDLLDLPKEFGT